MNRIILSLCSGTGAWEKPYVDAGYNVISITLPEYDVRTYTPPKNIYGILAAPPCTMFSFARTKAKTLRDLEEGMEIVRACLDVIWKTIEVRQDTKFKTLPLKFWALENPCRSMLKWFLGKPAFIFNPYDFGDNYKKETALWGHFNEPKKNPIKCNKPKFDKLPTKEIHEEYYGKLTRQERRAITPAGFAKAFFLSNQ